MRVSTKNGRNVIFFKQTGYIFCSSYIERDRQERQDSEFRQTANLPSSLTEKRFSETGSKIVPLTTIFEPGAGSKIVSAYLLPFSPYLGTDNL